MKRILPMVVWIWFLAGGLIASGVAAEMEIGGVTFPAEVEVAGKVLKLNGVALRKAHGFIKVYAGGFYLEQPSGDPLEAIESEQVKHFHLHYLTGMAKAKKLQEGFIEAIEKANPLEEVERYHEEIARYASWLDKDMQPGDTTVTTYVPGEGLTLWVAGVKKGTIAEPAFARMYFRYNFGEQADAKLREGYLGLK